MLHIYTAVPHVRSTLHCTVRSLPPSPQLEILAEKFQLKQCKNDNCLYALKTYLFWGQVKLTKRGSRDWVIFQFLFFYGRFWHEAPVAEWAPLNDITLMSLLNTYPNNCVKHAATEAIHRHLWYSIWWYLCCARLSDLRNRSIAQHYQWIYRQHTSRWITQQSHAQLPRPLNLILLLSIEIKRYSKWMI